LLLRDGGRRLTVDVGLLVDFVHISIHALFYIIRHISIAWICPFESSQSSFKPVLGLASGVVYATGKEGREGRGQY
jgi:hypothetical protein